MGGGCEGGKSASWALPSAGVLAPRSVSLPRPLSSRSYVFSSLATSAVSFATGALGMWIPLYLHRAQVVQKTAETCSSPPCGAQDRWGRAWGSGPGAGGRRGGGERDAVSPRTPALPPNPHSTVLCLCSLIFGAITCFTGFLGVVTGAGATRWCRLRTQRADPLVCAVGMLGSAIFICLIFVAAKSSIVGAYVSAGGGCRGSGQVGRRAWGELGGCRDACPLLTLRVNENRLQSSGTATQCTMETPTGSRSEKEGTPAHVRLMHCAAQRRLAPHCKATRVQ